MNIHKNLRSWAQWGLCAALIGCNLAVNAVTWPNVPLGSTTGAIPMTMLVAGKDHKLFYEAYNDASDIDGDGTLDLRFKPSIKYYGLFDTDLCYDYSSANNRFEPKGESNEEGACKNESHGAWSGRWLNYMTTSRIDALRKVLYGGYREVDTKSETVIRRAYIPQDAHSWGKEYHSRATDGYRISDYTALDQPKEHTRHFFGSMTPNAGTDCKTLGDCSDKLHPLLRIKTNVGGLDGGWSNGVKNPDKEVRIWQWASKENPVLSDKLGVLDSYYWEADFPSGTGNQDFQVRVQVCTATFNTDCKQYGDSDKPIYKPVGLLHEFGEKDSMLFGLLTGSYDQSMSGGRLRKVMSSFSNEVDPDTGIFTDKARIVKTFDALRIRDFNNGNSANLYRNRWLQDRPMAEGEFVDWGNPIAEMLYEATRYYAGKKKPTEAFDGASTVDTEVGLSSVKWDDPYDSASEAKAAVCARANFLTISDVNPSYDSDSVPGSSFKIPVKNQWGYFSGDMGYFQGDLTGLDVTSEGDVITGVESNITGQRFIGQSGSLYDSAPTAKKIESLGNIRGLAPEEPTKEGSYYSASVSRYAKTAELRPSIAGEQTVDNFVVALSSPLPKIEATLPNGKVIALIPFAKTVNGDDAAVKGKFQPTDQIVDFYVEKIANSGPKDRDEKVNGGRYYAEFQINFEDVEQGADHDMDAIARYVIRATADNKLEVTVTPTYQKGNSKQNMGYTISGTNRDGVYLVARDEPESPAYFLNVPAGESAGYCDKTTLTAEETTKCKSIPSVGQPVTTYAFSPGTGNAATLLKNPLWYAAKHGGFVDRNGSNTPDLEQEWDADGDGVPDTYFLVQNPLKLKESLKKAFSNIIERNASGGNVIANSTSLSTSALVYQGIYNSAKWSGDLVAYPVTTKGVSPTPAWNAAAKVPAPDDRKIYFGSTEDERLKGKLFTWANLSDSEEAMFDNNAALLQYIRGVRGQELQKNGTLRNRSATTVLGDIAHSSPFYSKDSGTVFIGANDGMLHAFDAKTGNELFAYIPSAGLPRLKALTSPSYDTNHQYFVDGDISVTSQSQTPGENLLVAALGRGGKGLFALNVTTPGSFKGEDVLWEHLSDTDVDTDLGYMLGRPMVAKMQNGDWAVIVGNGYNSTRQRAVLYVFNLKTGKLLSKLDTAVAGDNGLATPGLVFDTAGKVTTAYAGDLKGNVWKFDLSDADPKNWKIALSGSPLFTAKDGSGKAQPITARITATKNTVSGDTHFDKWFVHFGTGSDFQLSDPSDTSQQTWYGLIDEGSPISGRADLKERSFKQKTGTVSGKPVRTIEVATNGDMVGKKGFYLDLPAAGERIVTASNYYKLAEPVLLASSVIPLDDVCLPGGRGYLNAINPFTGARLTKPLFDVNNDGKFDKGDALNGDYVSSIDVGVGKPGEAILIGDRLVVGGSTPEPKDVRVNLGASSFKGRIAWREIVDN